MGTIGRGRLSLLLDTFAGLVVFGVPDWFVYGRPYESFYMYTLYNVCTGLSGANFGVQSPLIYLNLFRDHFGGILLPVGISLALLAGLYLWKKVRSADAIALAVLTYLIGHLSIGHKEPRFMPPIELFIIWAGTSAFLEYGSAWFLKRWVRITLIFFFVINGALALRALWGETWVAQGTFREMGSHLSQNKDATCAVISVKKPISSYLPDSPADLGKIALGFLPSEKRAESFPQTATRPLIWTEVGPQCEPESLVFLHLHRPDSRWQENDCELLPSGILRQAPKSLWSRILKKNWASGSWYRCPSGILGLFAKQEVRHTYTRRIPVHEELPPISISGEEPLKNYLSPESDGGIGDWPW